MLKSLHHSCRDFSDPNLRTWKKFPWRERQKEGVVGVGAGGRLRLTESVTQEYKDKTICGAARLTSKASDAQESSGLHTKGTISFSRKQAQTRLPQ